MKESIKEYLEKIGYAISAVLIIVAIIAAFLYSQFFGVNFAIAILSMLFGVFGAYYIFMSFETEEKPLELEAGEKRNLRTIDIGLVMLPKKLGSIRSSETHKNLSIYLTNKRIIARNVWGECFFDVPLKSVNFVKTERVLMTTYVRVNYNAGGKQKDALLFVGNHADVELWMQRLRKFGINDKTATETVDESETEEDAYAIKKQVKQKR